MQELVRLKDAAVAAEDYDEAKHLKSSIERLKVSRRRFYTADIVAWHSRAEFVLDLPQQQSVRGLSSASLLAALQRLLTEITQ